MSDTSPEFSPLAPMDAPEVAEAPAVDLVAASATQDVLDSAIAPGPEVPKAPDAPDRFARSFEKLSLKEMQLREREKVLTASEQYVARAQKLEGMAKGDKLELLRELGVSVDDVLRAQLNGGKADPVDEIEALKAKISRLEETTNQHKTSMDLREMANRWDADFNQMVKADEYAIIRDWPGMQQDIIADVAKRYQNTKQLLHPKVVLDTMVEQLRGKLKAVSKYVPSETTSAPVAPSPKAVAPGASKTLKTQQAAVPRFSRLDDDDAEMARIAAKYSTRNT